LPYFEGPWRRQTSTFQSISSGHLDAFRLEAQGTDLVIVVYGIHFILKADKLAQICLEVLELRVLRIESLELIIDILLPEPVVLLEAIQELLHVLDPLDGAGQKHNDLSDLVIEWLALVRRDILWFQFHTRSVDLSTRLAALLVALFNSSRVGLSWQGHLKVHINSKEGFRTCLGAFILPQILSFIQLRKTWLHGEGADT
jgi:hypothetical protein